jgi:predicted aspartyl protease
MEKKITSSEDQLRSQYDVRTIRVAARSDRTALSANDSHEGNTPLGEVRVKVKLTNAVDEALVRRGLLTADKIRSYEADALVDTGAVRSVLPIHVVQLLGLATVGKTRAVYANDLTDDVDITEMVGIDLVCRRTTEEMLVLGSEVLIGQTVLESLDLLVDCVSGRVIPNPAHPDQPVIKVKMILRDVLQMDNTGKTIGRGCKNYEFSYRSL